MKSFFEDLGRKIGETAETVTNKAGEAVEVQRLKNQIRSLERGNERDYMELGRMIYDHYKAGEVVDAEAIAICEAIQNREESIDKYEKDISDVKGDVACGACGRAVAKGMCYCPYCGSKVPEDTAEEETSYADEMKAKAAEAAETVKEKTEDAADAMKEKAEDAADKIKENTGNAADTVKEKASDLADAVKERTAGAADTIREKAVDAAEMLKEKAEEAEEKVRKMTED